MLKLPNVTLAMANTDCPDMGIKTLLHCASLVEFGAVKMFSNIAAAPKPIELIKVPALGMEGYNNFMVLELARHINTDFVLTVQVDGFILNADRWQDKFLTFDYVGAPWALGLQKSHPQGTRVGNGGFCLRSKKFTELTATLTDFNSAKMKGFEKAEDFYLCKTRHDYLTARGMKFADLATAADFSLEAPIAEQPRTYGDVFGFHGSPKHYPTQGFLDMVRRKY